MKNSDNTRSKSSVWGTLILSASCIAYVISKQWLFLLCGIIGFTLLLVLKD